MRLKFLGATGTVTGSKYLLYVEGKRILVDCGLFEGIKQLRLRNWAPLPIDPRLIDAVVLTHAHIDHSGYIPLLVKHGFKGPIYATEATCDLCSIMLPDSGHIQEEDARAANKYGYSKHRPALPLYTKEDAEISLRHFQPVKFNTPNAIIPNGDIVWHRAGHILGASVVSLRAKGKKIVFSGDLGRMEDPIMFTPDKIKQSDYLVLESTYGDRLHDNIDPKLQLQKIITETIQIGGTVVIPAFAVGRTQNILYYLHQLKKENKLPHVPIYLDSPMAINATKIFCKYAEDHKLTAEVTEEVCAMANYVNTRDESKMVSKNHTAKIIISASGMATGGRVLHHLQIYGPDPLATILLTGYQAAETRGARILSGEKKIKVHGEQVIINARIESLTNTSAHADYAEILEWLKGFEKPPKSVFITHGEPVAAKALKKHIEDALGWNCVIPEYLDEVNLA